MDTNKVQRTSGAMKLSKAEALVKARQIAGAAVNTIAIDGEQADITVKQKQEQKVQSEAASLLRQAEAKVSTQLVKSTNTNKSSSANKSSTDPLDTLSRVEEENSAEEQGAEDIWASEAARSEKTASFYILTHTFKSMSSKFVNMFRGEAKRNYQKTAIYLLEKTSSVTSTGSSSET